jgi:hypothetical protein
MCWGACEGAAAGACLSCAAGCCLDAAAWPAQQRGSCVSDTPLLLCVSGAALSAGTGTIHTNTHLPARVVNSCCAALLTVPCRELTACARAPACCCSTSAAVLPPGSRSSKLPACRNMIGAVAFTRARSGPDQRCLWIFGAQRSGDPLRPHRQRCRANSCPQRTILCRKCGLGRSRANGPACLGFGGVGFGDLTGWCNCKAIEAAKKHTVTHSLWLPACQGDAARLPRHPRTPSRACSVGCPVTHPTFKPKPPTTMTLLQFRASCTHQHTRQLDTHDEERGWHMPASWCGAATNHAAHTPAGKKNGNKEA